MDMDPKGVGEGNNSKNVDKDMINEKGGVEGKQAQSNFVEAIQIGTMKLAISPKGTLNSVKNSNQKELVFNPILHDLNLLLNDNVCTESHADYLVRGSASGLPQAPQVDIQAGSSLAVRPVQLQLAGAGGPAVSSSAGADQPGGDTMQGDRQAAPLPTNGRPVTAASVGHNAPVEIMPTCCTSHEVGSSVAEAMGSTPLCNAFLPQTIQPTDASAVANHEMHDELMIAQPLDGGRGSSVHNNAGNNGMCCNDFNFCCSLDDFGHSDGVSHESILDYVGSGLHSTRVV
jgi:hypothetical protein